MVSPNFWPDEKILRQQNFRAKNRPSNFRQILAKIWPKIFANFRENFPDLQRKKFEKNPKDFSRRKFAISRNFAQFSQTCKEKNLKNSENPTDHLPVKMTHFDDKNDQIPPFWPIYRPKSTIFGPASGQKSRFTPDFPKIRRILGPKNRLRFLGPNFRQRRKLALKFSKKISGIKIFRRKIFPKFFEEKFSAKILKKNFAKN